MANEIYHRSNWGESKPEGFGDMYFDPSATNKLYNRSTYYENSDATDKILGDIPNKASIVLTPTGYSEDKIGSVIPVDGNGDFTFARNSSATRVNQAGLIEASQSNDTPRLDYTTGQGAFLLEPQSTNLITYSEDYSQSEWTNSSYTKDATITNNTQSVAPDGTSGVFQYECTVSGSNSQLGALKSITSGVAYTSSFYIKRINGVGSVKIRDVNNTELDITDNLTSDWKRYTITGTSNSTNGRVYVNVLNAGDIIEVWGVQLEQQSFVTSYIPTVGSTVTRSAESANSSGNSDLFNDSEGVLYAEIAALTQNSGDSRRFTISDGSIDNRVSFELDETEGLIKLFLSGSGTTNTLTTTTDVSINFKIAASYNSTSLKLFLDGTQIGADTSVVLPTGLNVFSFNNPFGGGTSPFYGKVKGVAVFKEALTDIELEKLTSWRDFRDLAESLEYTLVTLKSDAIVVSAYGTTSGGGGVSGGGSGGGGGY